MVYDDLDKKKRTTSIILLWTRMFSFFFNGQNLATNQKVAPTKHFDRIARKNTTVKVYTLTDKMSF